MARSAVALAEAEARVSDAAREGVRHADYAQWREALGDEGRAALATTKRIRALEREPAREEKALAEAAALLVLKKNSRRSRRTRTPTPARSATEVLTTRLPRLSG
jgi:hypothetical protein